MNQLFDDVAKVLVAADLDQIGRDLLKRLRINMLAPSAIFRAAASVAAQMRRLRMALSQA